MRNYRHLSWEERKVLGVLLERGESLRSIARTLERSHSSLCREIRRNRPLKNYHPLRAEWIADKRLRQSHRRPRLKNAVLRRRVESWLLKRWSPEIIAGRLARLKGRKLISPEAIYQWVYAEAPHLIRSLPRHRPVRGARRMDRSKSLIPGRVSVYNRPPEANLRLESGHWEVDLVIGKGKSALQVAVERKTRTTRLAKIPDKTAIASYHALCRIFSSVPQHLRRSVTYDNGFENALHQLLNARFNMRSFFCLPSHCWEKPTVENTNGLIRWFLPKRSNFDMISDQRILEIENWLNSRPRKCLQFLTPLEAITHL